MAPDLVATQVIIALIPSDSHRICAVAGRRNLPEGRMSQLEKRIADKFLKSLADDKAVNSAAIDQLRALLASSSKPKADELVKIFTSPADGEVK